MFCRDAKRMYEDTLFIIKPDAICENQVGKIIDIVLKNKFKIVAMKMIKMSRKQASEFYAEHKGKAFYKPLVEFMSSNPSIVAVLRKRGAVKSLRKIIGATNPAKASEGTIRKLFARDGRHNVVHASDSAKSAKREISFFFSKGEIFLWKYKNYPVVRMS